MSQAPSMPMYWDAYLADTTHLTTEEHGAYLLLLAAMWRRNGWVPDDDRDNARILGLTAARWKRTKARLASLLVFKDGQITQKNLLKIWEKTQEKIEKNRENGARGGRPKASENKAVAKAKGSVSDNPNETIPEPEPHISRSSSSARGADELFLDVLSAVGLTNGPLPTHWMPPAAELHVNRWRELDLTDAEIVDAARESRKQHPEPPRGPKALDGVMQRLAGAKRAETLQPALTTISGGRNDRSKFDTAHREYVRRLASGAIDRGPDPSDPFAGG